MFLLEYRRAGRNVSGQSAAQKVYFDTADTSLVIVADAKSGAVLHSFNLNHWYLYSSPAIAGGMMYLGSTQEKLVGVDLDGFTPVWTFETEGMKQRGGTYTKSDGAPDMLQFFRSDFYDDMVAGVDRVMSMGSILGAPVIMGNGSVLWKRGRECLCAHVDVNDVKNVREIEHKRGFYKELQK